MMAALRRFWSRVLGTFGVGRGQDGGDDEIGGHIGLLQQRFEARGMPPGEARRAALNSFGGVEQLREHLHDQQSFPWLDALRQDVRYAIRTIVRTPVVSLAIVVTFALGIGANTAIFSLVNSVLLTPLAYSSPDRIVIIEPFWKNRTNSEGFRTSSAPDFHDWRAQSHVFDAMAYHGGGEFRVIVDGEPTFGSVQLASPDFFRVFGVTPAAGRFWTADVLVATTSLPAPAPEEQRRATIFYRDLIDRVRQMPGVRQAAGVRTMPFADGGSSSGYTIDGNPTPPLGSRPIADIQVVTPGFFDTLNTRIRRGRDFSAGDEYGRPQVAIVNERLARDAFGSEDGIGRTIRNGMTRETGNGMQIVGIVADARAESPDTGANPTIYLPYLQHPGPGSRLELLAHTSIPPETLAASIREAARALNPEVPVRFSTMDDALGTALAYPRFRAALVAGFAMLAVALALVGIYGVLSFLVAERTPEIGVRMALGALRLDIFSHTIGTSMRLVAGGLVAGLLATLAVVRALQTVLYGVSPRDPLTIAAVVALFVVTAFLASSIPALRASRVDPLAALRHD